MLFLSSSKASYRWPVLRLIAETQWQTLSPARSRPTPEGCPQFALPHGGQRVPGAFLNMPTGRPGARRAPLPADEHPESWPSAFVVPRLGPLRRHRWPGLGFLALRFQRANLIGPDGNSAERDVIPLRNCGCQRITHSATQGDRCVKQRVYWHLWFRFFARFAVITPHLQRFGSRLRPP